MQETPIIIINNKNFTLGESPNERNPDRGFSPESYGVNVYAEKGTLYFGDAATDRSTNLEGRPLAIINDPDFLGNDNYIVDEDGKYYTLDGTTLTKRQTDATNTYTLGTTDLIKFNGEVFATATQQVIRLTGGDLTTIDNVWWTTTRGHAAPQNGYRHPLEVVEDTMYIGDKNEIHTWDGTTSVSAAMSLPTGVNIISLRKHPNGQNLLAFCGETANYSHTLGGGGFIYVIDTVNLEFIREIKIEAQVEGTRNVGGVIYTTYGNKIGYFNGDGITHLRDLNGSQNTTYSQQISNAEDILLIRDGKEVLAYGDLGKGNVWWRMYQADTSSGNSMYALGYKGSGTVLVGFIDPNATQKLVEAKINTTGVVGKFYSNQYLTGKHVAIRRIEIDHTETPDNATYDFDVELLDAAGNSVYSANVEYASIESQFSPLYMDAFLRGVQLTITPSAGAMGFREIRIFGENIE